MSTKDTKHQIDQSGIIKKSSAFEDTGDMRSAGRSCRYFSCMKTEFLPARFLRQASTKMAKGLKVLFTWKTAPKPSPATAGRPKPGVNLADSPRIEAIEDCIEFIYSSSSLARSNSVTAN